ncbi:MAG: SRPBCC family protein [Chitinophagaceae bacterium]
MHILIIIVLAIGLLIALLLVAALFVKKEYTIERTITINRFRPEVFNYIRFLKNQDHYSKWVRTDPGMKKEFRGADGTVGFVYAWDGNKKAGKGEQEITHIHEGSIETELRFIRPFAATAQSYMQVEALPGNTPHQTRVTWGLKGRSTYPLNLMTALMSKALGRDMETSLVMLKQQLGNETAPA